jgi:hypothetical protein
MIEIMYNIIKIFYLTFSMKVVLTYVRILFMETEVVVI